MSANDPVIRRSAERMLELTDEEKEEIFGTPHNETQSIVDHMERHVDDEPYDDDWIDEVE